MRLIKAALLLSLVLGKVAFGFENIVEARMKEQASTMRQTPSAISSLSESKRFFNAHSMLLIYSSKCQYCHLFAPTLKRYVDERGLDVRSISLDGRPINDFPNIEQADLALIDTAYGDMPHGTPALFIVNEKTKAIYPALFGNASYDELNQRMDALTKEIKEFEGRA